MNTVTKVLIVLGVVLLVGGVSITGTFIGLNNECVKHEATIVAQYEQNQNNYDNYFKKVKEVAQVPDMYVDDLKSVYKEAITARYGDEGSQAMFQWLQEHNPNFDASLYKQIQQVIEAGRNSFEANQKMLLDKKRNYDVTLKQFPNNIIVRILGFPKINLSEYSIVTSAETNKVFEDKESEPIKIR